MPMPKRDDIGQRFGLLVVLRQEWRGKVAFIDAQCDCGNIWTGHAQPVRQGIKTCCGCQTTAERRKDRTGQRFGRLVIDRMTWRNGAGYVEATCDCGRPWQGMIRQLISGNTTSCGCARRDMLHQKRHDLTGKSFGYLRVLEMRWKTRASGNHFAQAVCQCICGKVKTIAATHLVSGKLTSCGCQKKRMSLEATKGKRRLGARKRRLRILSLPDTLTIEQWEFALRYWKHVCAVCQNPPGFFTALVMDHFIPLTHPECPGTINTNIVPMCDGLRGCNTQKNNKDPLLWLTAKLGTRAAKKKLREIEAYFRAAQAFAAAQEGAPVCAAS